MAAAGLWRGLIKHHIAGALRPLRSHLVTPQTKLQFAAAMATESLPKYETLLLSRPKDYVIQVELNRPDKRNAMNKSFWREMVECFTHLSQDTTCRCVIISASGSVFTAGLDLNDAAEMFFSVTGNDVARKAFYLRDNVIKPYQMSFTSIEKCSKPVIAAIQGPCVGGGIDLITACDIRLCTDNAWFQIKEVDIGLAADVGTLQRLPKIVGNESKVRELVYTGRRFMAEEAKSIGLISDIFSDHATMIEAAIKMATLIVSKSPVAVQGSKINLNYSRDHTVDESLDYMATWNMSMLQTEDIVKSIQAQVQKETPVFSKL